MGQRLNIEIKINNKIQANCYYHWSAYTSSAKFLVQEILTYLKRCRQKDPLLKAIRCLEKTDAELTPSELVRAKELYPNTKFKKCTSRSTGLIAITEDGMEDTRNWEEGKVIIDIDNNMLDFDVYWTDKLEDCEYSDEYIAKMLRDFNPYNISFDYFIKNFNTFAIEPVIYDGLVVSPIE